MNFNSRIELSDITCITFKHHHFDLALSSLCFRDLDKEKMKLERQEKQIINDIKKMAKQGEMAAVKVMAKDLVRTRRYVKKFIMMKANIQAVSLKITTLKSQGAMANAMKGVTKAMGAMNKQINMPQMQKIMMEFEKEVRQKLPKVF